VKLTYGNSQFIMHSSGSLYWPSKEVLLIADVHFGKIDHFRKNGSALPNKVGLENFKNLDRVIDEFQPKGIIFLGDLFHSTQNRDWDRFYCLGKRAKHKDDFGCG